MVVDLLLLIPTFDITLMSFANLAWHGSLDGSAPSQQPETLTSVGS